MNHEQMEEIKRHFDVVAEGLEHEIQLVAEGIANVDEKLERFRGEVQEEFKANSGDTILNSFWR